MKDSGIRAPLPAILRQVEIFHTLGDEEREALASRMERRRFRAGDTVFREGDASDGLYVVHSGEVGVVVESDSEKRTLARLGPGECFGEMSLLTGEPRSTSVFATLDSDLLFLGDAAFEALLRRYPAVALAIGRTLSLRLRRANLAAREEAHERIVVCVSTTPLVSGCVFAVTLSRALAACRGADALLLCLGPAPPTPPPRKGIEELPGALRAGENLDLEAYASPAGAGVRVIALPEGAEAGDPRLLGPLLSHAVEQFGGAVVHAEAGDARGAAGSPGARRVEEAVRQSDAAVLLVDSSEESLARTHAFMGRTAPAGSGAEGKWRLALVRGGVVQPGTVQGVEERIGRPVTYQIAAEKGASGVDAQGVARIARRISRISVGLALGGGGARGLAHIGILDVLHAERIPVDVIGGTSIGSIISALHVVGHGPSEIREIVRREWVDRNPLNDYTIPKVAFVRGRRGDKVLMRVFGATRIEDLSTPFFAVAADLVTAGEVVLSRGPIWLAVRASGSIPVLLTPVKVDGRFLVDGGVINNVPGDHLARFGADVSIAVDVSPRREPYFERLLDRPPPRSFLGRLARRSGLLEEWLDYPGMIRTLRRIISIEGLEIMKTKSAAFDACIQPEVEGFDLLDFRKIDRLIDAGREAAMKALPAVRLCVEKAASRGRSLRV